MKRRNEANQYADDVQAEIRAASRENREIVATSALFQKLGHGPKNPVRVMRAFCLDCCGGSTAAVRKCTSVGCALWPYRMGKNPFRRKKGDA